MGPHDREVPYSMIPVLSSPPFREIFQRRTLSQSATMERKVDGAAGVAVQASPPQQRKAGFANMKEMGEMMRWPEIALAAEAMRRRTPAARSPAQR